MKQSRMKFNCTVPRKIELFQKHFYSNPDMQMQLKFEVKSDSASSDIKIPVSKTDLTSDHWDQNHSLA